MGKETPFSENLKSDTKHRKTAPLSSKKKGKSHPKSMLWLSTSPVNKVSDCILTFLLRKGYLSSEFSD